MDNQHENLFWKPKSIEQLATEQGINGPQSLDNLVGAAANLWASDEEFHEFLSSIDNHRREAASA